MDKLGFTFYPKDWWTSESYFDLSPIQRYYYLECLFIMYSNDGYMKTQKTQFENRIRTQVLDSDWVFVTERFILDNGFFTHTSVNKRLRKTITNRENGKKGGRPKKEEEKPKKPKTETQKNPPLEREREREIEIENNITSNEEILNKNLKEKIEVFEFSEIKNEEEKKEKKVAPKKRNQDFKIELQESPSWVESVAMQKKIKCDEVLKLLDEFQLHLESVFDDKPNKKEYANHFVNWVMKKNITVNQNSNGKSDSEKPVIGRVTAEVLAKNLQGWDKLGPG